MRCLCDIRRNCPAREEKELTPKLPSSVKNLPCVEKVEGWTEDSITSVDDRKCSKICNVNSLRFYYDHGPNEKLATSTKIGAEIS